LRSSLDMAGIRSVLLTWLLATTALASPVSRKTGPSIVLDKGTFEGVDTGLNFQFLGIPFTQPV
jgi:acetylcholinesterase